MCQSVRYKENAIGLTAPIMCVEEDRKKIISNVMRDTVDL